MSEQTLRPAFGFDWLAVSWAGPDEPCSENCSLCEAEIKDDDVPLMMWNEEGWCAQFCTGCQRRWWGMTT